MSAGRLQVALDAPDVVTLDGERLPTSPHIHKLVALLLANAGTIVGFRALSAHFGWADPGVSISSKVAVCKARKVLADVGAPVRIETVYGHGYRLQVLG